MAGDEINNFLSGILNPLTNTVTGLAGTSTTTVTQGPDQSTASNSRTAFMVIGAVAFLVVGIIAYVLISKKQ